MSVTRRFALTSLAFLLILFSALPATASPDAGATYENEQDVLDVAIDGNGYQYIASYATGPNNWDAVVKKVSPSGTIVWSRTLAGYLSDVATSVAVDPQGNVYAAGQTSSPDFPRTDGAWRTTFDGGDAWAAKFDANGTLLYSTLVGGSDDDEWITDIDWASSGTLAIVGRTFSCDFPVTSGAFDKTSNSCVAGGNGGDAFVVKLAANGRSAVFSTYLGGSGEEIPAGLTVSRSSGTIMIAGSTASLDFPTTTGALQRTHQGGEYDGFVTKLAASGGSLSFSTLLGGSDVDFIEGLARDVAGNAFVTGWTYSADLPATPGAFQTSFGGGLECSYFEYPEGNWIDQACSDAFVARIHDGGAALDYLTYLGAVGYDEGHDVAIDATGIAYVTGATNSTAFPRVDTRGETDTIEHPMFAAAFSSNGEGSVYAELLPMSRYPNAIVATSAGRSYHGGTWFQDSGYGYVTQIGMPTSGLVISPRGGNEFWVETFVGGTKAGSVTKVEARDSDTDWTPLAKKEWGFYAGSVHVEPGHVVDIRATASDGSVAQACYQWPTLEPAACPTPPPPPPAPAVVFAHGGGNEWWVEVKIDPKPVSAQAMDTGGAWVPLSFKSWGEWAASFHIEPGHQVKFSATYGNGTTAESCWFTHPQGVSQCGTTPPPPPPPSGTFDATFENVRGNEWWIETDVTVTGGTLAGVDARVNGGAWIPLEKKSWGSWAKSIHAPPGSTVEFRARATDGSADVSAAYAWPPG